MSKQWIHIYCGLTEKKHLRRMGTSMPLYLYLLSKCDRKTGSVSRKLGTIKKETGYSIPTIKRHLANLRKWKYIRTERKQYSLKIQVINWRPLTDYKKNRDLVKNKVNKLSGEMGQK